MKLEIANFLLPATTLLVVAVLSAGAFHGTANPGFPSLKDACPTAVERTLNFTKDGLTQKGEVVGDRLMLLGADGKMAQAGDGGYRMANGKTLIVKNGKVTNPGAVTAAK